MDLLRDPVASASHFLMAGLAGVATLFVLRLTRHDPVRWRCVLVYGACATLLYLASGLYHGLRLPREQLQPFQLLDMSAIYLMIAGSATPLLVILVPGRLRLNLLAGVWGFSGLGIVALWVLPRPDLSVIIACYAAIGVIACLGLSHFYRATGWEGMRWFAASCGLYAGGAVVELAAWPVLWPGVVGPHEVLHFCDIGGTACHLVFLVGFVLPYRATAVETVPMESLATDPIRPGRAAA